MKDTSKLPPQNIKHLFTLCLGPQVLKELLCREQFAISQSTDEYDKLLSQIPGEFVGTSTRLRPLVRLLCLKMEQAFQDTGLTRPPWRQPESMLSKWLPNKVGLLRTVPPLPACTQLVKDPRCLTFWMTFSNQLCSPCHNAQWRAKLPASIKSIELKKSLCTCKSRCTSILSLKAYKNFNNLPFLLPSLEQLAMSLKRCLPVLQSQDKQIESPGNSPRMATKAIDGKSPSGPLSYCSSRTSSDGGNSPERLRDAFPRKYSGQVSFPMKQSPLASMCNEYYTEVLAQKSEWKVGKNQYSAMLYLQLFPGNDSTPKQRSIIRHVLHPPPYLEILNHELTFCFCILTDAEILYLGAV